MKKTICVIGASGLLGHKITQTCYDFEIFGTYNQTSPSDKNTNLIKADITNFENCKKISDIKPDWIINTAAITDVDYCEKNKEKAYLVNVVGTRNLVQIAKKLNCKLIHISTDGIFSGNTTNYGEDDTPNPVNYYGKTKLESENEVKTLDDYLILRTSVLYGFIPKNLIASRSSYLKPLNFALWVLQQLNQDKNIRIVNDQISNPTLADNLARIILECMRLNLSGTFHSTDLNCISRFDFSKKIAKKFGYSYNLITEITSKDLNQFALRPTKTCLDCSKIIKKGIKISNLDESLDVLYNQVKKEDPSMIFSS